MISKKNVYFAFIISITNRDRGLVIFSLYARHQCNTQKSGQENPLCGQIVVKVARNYIFLWRPCLYSDFYEKAVALFNDKHDAPP